MSNTYKGYNVPEIMSDGRLFHIISDEGIFDGYSIEAVTQHWTNKVDALYRQFALDDGYIEVSEGIIGCPDCGALVWDVYAHRNFHGDLTTDR